MFYILKVFILILLVSCSKQGENPEKPKEVVDEIFRSYEIKTSNPEDMSVISLSNLVLSYENINYFHKNDPLFLNPLDIIKSNGDFFVLNLKNIGNEIANITNIFWPISSKLQVLSNSCTLLLPNSSCELSIKVVAGDPELNLSVNFQNQQLDFPIKILSPNGVLCNLTDAISNGWDSYRSIKASGEKIASDISRCGVSQCEEDYQINSLNKKCEINLDIQNTGIVSNQQLEKLFHDISQNKASPIITLDHNKIYELEAQLEVPSNVTIQGTSSSQRPLIRKKNNLINGIDKSMALLIKNHVESYFSSMSIPANQRIVFNPNGEVMSYGGLTDAASLKTSMQAINSFIENQGYLNAYFINLKNKYYRFDVANFGSRCVLSETISSITEEYSTLCSGNIPAGTRRWSPFYQEILNTPDEELSSLNPNVAEPVFLLSGQNTVLKDLQIECPSNVPYFPVNNMENVSENNPFGSVKQVGGVREVAAISLSGVWAYNAKNITLNNLKIENCALGIYTINSQNVEISNSQIMTAIEPAGILPVSQRKAGDIGLKWNQRFHGYNSIRIHGTLDRNFLIQNNIIGETGRGSIKGIHIHGTSLSGRDSDDDDFPNNPPQGFPSEDEGLTKLAAYANKVESRVLRKNIKIIGNVIQGHHNAGIDLEGDQLNIDIRSNTISNIKNKFFILNNLPGSSVANSVGAGIRILTQRSSLSLFNFFGTGTPYSKFFYGNTHNLNIQENTLSNNELGIFFIGGVNNNTLAFNNFPENIGTSNILSNVATNFNCGLLSMRENCSLKATIQNNQFINILKSPSVFNTNSAALQSYCLYIQDAIGVDIKNNSFNTCNIPDYNFLGTGSAIRVVNSHKIHFGLGNTFSVSSDMASTRKGLSITTTSGWNRYVALSLANSPTFTRYVSSEFNLTGCSGSCNSYLNLTSGYPAPANLAPTTETSAPFNDEASVPFKFMGSLELDAIQE